MIAGFQDHWRILTDSTQKPGPISLRDRVDCRAPGRLSNPGDPSVGDLPDETTKFPRVHHAERPIACTCVSRCGDSHVRPIMHAETTGKLEKLLEETAADEDQEDHRDHAVHEDDFGDDDTNQAGERSLSLRGFPTIQCSRDKPSTPQNKTPHDTRVEHPSGISDVSRDEYNAPSSTVAFTAYHENSPSNR